MAGRGGIEALLDLMDEAFRGVGLEASNESQALLTNLASVTANSLARPLAERRALDRVDRFARRQPAR